MATVTAPRGREKPAPKVPPTSPAPAGDLAARNARLFTRMAVALLVVGVVGRLVRYFLAFPIWGDEAMVSFPLVSRDYLGLLRTLEYKQVAPILFLWSQHAAVRLLGPAEWAVRLGPFLAGMVSLALFWRLARLTLKPLPALFAVGLLAVARWPVSMSTLAKPYSFDLLASLLLLLPAVEWLRRPDRLVWPALLALATPFALLGSYPAVFVAGAVSVALLPTAWRAGWKGRALFVLFNLLMLGAFFTSYWVVGREQEDPVAGSVKSFMLQYWEGGFPPAAPLAFVRWFALINTGRMMAYPVGGSDGQSAVTFLLFVVGVAVWWKARRRAWLVLALGPFALNFLAAVLQRYPYGGCCRLSQHLAPAVCLLAGAGMAALLERFARSDGLRLRWAGALCILLGVCGASGLACDVIWPYRDAETAWMRDVTRRALARAEPGDEIVVAQDKYGVDAVIRWYLETEGSQVRWKGDIDWDRPAAGRGRLWVLNLWGGRGGPAEAGPPPPDARALQGWELAGRSPSYFKPVKNTEPIVHFDVYEWRRPADGSR